MALYAYLELCEPAIYAEIKGCRDCPRGMVEHNTAIRKNGDGSVLFIGIQPNWKGHPKNKRSKSTGHFFNAFNELRKKYSLDKYRFTNLVKCATEKPSEPPTYLEVNNCLKFLEREIKEFGIRLAVFVGKGSYKAYHDYIEKEFRVKSSWCYHYSGKVRMMKHYKQKQRERMKAISKDISEQAKQLQRKDIYQTA